MRRTDIPTYELAIDALDESMSDATGFDKIAYVNNPAIEEVGIYMSKLDEEILQSVDVRLSNVEKQQVVAPLLIPNKLIAQVKNGQYFNIVFSPEIIVQLKAKADNEKKLSDLNIMKDTHRGVIAPAFILDNWIIEDSNDKAYTEYGFDITRVPIGTWMVTTQITDKVFWENEIKKNKKFAYSIEAFLHMKLTNLKLNKIEMEKEQMMLPKGEHKIGDKIYVVDEAGAILEIKDAAVEVAAEEMPKEEAVAEVAPVEKVKEEVVAEEMPKEKAVEEVVAEELPEVDAVETPEEEAVEDSVIEGIYEEIAKLKTMISDLTSKMTDGPIEMSEQKNSMAGSISALIAARKRK